MSDLENLIEILNLIGVKDDWYSNEEIAEMLIAHGVKYVPPIMKGGAER